MSAPDPTRKEPPGPIAWMVGNSVASNLLMFAIVAAGLVALTGLGREAWPVLPFYTIEVSMAYPGANPREIEESIVIKIEDRVSGLENVKAVRSVAAPGMASVRVEMNSSADMDQALQDIETAISQIQTFPAAAERAVIREMTNESSVIRMIVHGNAPERSLKELAYWIEDELASLPEVSLVEVSGMRNYEISIEVAARRLRALGLTLEDIAGIVRASSLDLSAGSIDTRESQVRVRTQGQRYAQQDFEDIVLLAREDGAVLRLGDIATVRDEFQDVDLILRHNNQPAIFVEVFRGEDERVMDVAAAVREHIVGVLGPSLPDGIGITVWNDESLSYSERVDLLVKNGFLGLLMVFTALALFLQIRLALWVVVGLTVTFVGTLAVMLAFDISLSTISLFVFVLAIGIVVDDAVIVSEQIQRERARGTPGVAAAIRGARRIKSPLTFAVLTSIVAFIPLLYIPGGVGDIWRPLPVMVIGMLAISLVESLFILPSHLSHLPGPDWRPKNVIDRFLAVTQGAVDKGLKRFVNGPLDRLLRFATDQPLTVVAGAIGALVLSISLIPAGFVATTFADIVEGNFVVATIEMPDGATAERTYEMASEIETAGLAVIKRLSEQRPQGAPPLLSGVTVTVGRRARAEGGSVIAEPTLNPEANIAAVEFRLVSGQERQVTTTEVAQAWRDEVGLKPAARSVAITGEALNLGNPVEVVLSHPDGGRLAEIATEVVNRLRDIEGVFDVRSDHAPGVREVQLQLRPEARTLGVTVEELARQARAAFFGVEALRVQRGSEEVRVMARLPAEERNAITDIERYLIRTPSGGDVALNEVASLRIGNSQPAINREDGQPVVTVIADIDLLTISSGEANGILANTILAELVAQDPDLSYFQGGEQARQVESLSSLYRGFAIAMLLIFALLAIPLRSYAKPFIVMSIIPFGLIGVILGHWLLQVPVGASTIMGVLGLSGVLVNDSLVMVNFIDQRLREGAPPRTAVIDGAKGRFRPIMLTSVTTFLGFTPLILEPSIQAQFLRPFAAALGIGILITTVILMLVVPAIATLQMRFASRVRSALAKPPATAPDIS